jgi:hypothetical protein
LLAICAAGCAATHIPDPKEAAAAYAAAAQKGDADALYDMMSSKGRRTLTRDEVRTIVKDERGELADRAKAIGLPASTVKSEARMKYADGEEVALAVEPDGYKITAADALPASPETPVQALGQFRRVLARRSYAGLLRLLSKGTRAAMEDHLRTLVDGLDDPEALDILVSGDTATVVLPGGHQVHLKLDGGVWRIDDFE